MTQTSTLTAAGESAEVERQFSWFLTLGLVLTENRENSPSKLNIPSFIERSSLAGRILPYLVQVLPELTGRYLPTLLTSCGIAITIN
jgi:hypothetical protein